MYGRAATLVGAEVRAVLAGELPADAVTSW
jgi:hypothetical protein